MAKQAIQVTLNTQPVELYKILKFEGIYASGAEAKNAIADGLVMLNGKVETQKRKKIMAGDEIMVGNDVLNIVLE